MFQEPKSLSPGTKRLQAQLERLGRDEDVKQGCRSKKRPKGAYGHAQTPETREKIAESVRNRQ